MLETEQQKPMMLLGAAGFVLLLAGLVWFGVTMVRANVSPVEGSAPPRSQSSTPVHPDDEQFTPVQRQVVYVERKPEDERFTVEVPPEFNFVPTEGSFTAADGRKVPIHTYTAGGGKDELDGFAVVCYEGLLGKRSSDLTEEDVLEQLAKGIFQQTHCTVDLHETRQRSGADVLHMQGKGWQDASGRSYWLVLEARVKNENVYVAFFAGYRAAVLKDARGEHFLDTFNPAN